VKCRSPQISRNLSFHPTLISLHKTLFYLGNLTYNGSKYYNIKSSEGKYDSELLIRFRQTPLYWYLLKRQMTGGLTILIQPQSQFLLVHFLYYFLTLLCQYCHYNQKDQLLENQHLKQTLEIYLNYNIFETSCQVTH
jgi:hypothetical protein